MRAVKKNSHTCILLIFLEECETGMYMLKCEFLKFLLRPKVCHYASSGYILGDEGEDDQDLQKCKHFTTGKIIEYI